MFVQDHHSHASSVDTISNSEKLSMVSPELRRFRLLAPFRELDQKKVERPVVPRMRQSRGSRRWCGRDPHWR
jgi:hypothetical protein